MMCEISRIKIQKFKKGLKFKKGKKIHPEKIGTRRGKKLWTRVPSGRIRDRC